MSRITEEEKHYKSLTDFFKSVVGIAAGAITIIVGVALYVTFSSVKDMKETMKSDLNDANANYKNSITELKSQVSDLKKDASTTVEKVEYDSKTSVLAAKEYADQEISKISSTTHDLALNETRKQLNDIFATDKIQNLIEYNAVKEVKGKVKEMVLDATKNITRITDAASQMRIGLRSGMYQLKNIFESPTNSADSLVAKNLYESICRDYQMVSQQYSRDSAWQDFFGKQFKIKTFPINIIDNKMPTDENEKALLTKLINSINGTNDLTYVSEFIRLLSECTKIPFRAFDFDAINKWYSNLKK